MQLIGICIAEGCLSHCPRLLLGSSALEMLAKCGNHLKIKKKLPQQRFVALLFLRDTQHRMEAER